METFQNGSIFPPSSCTSKGPMVRVGCSEWPKVHFHIWPKPNVEIFIKCYPSVVFAVLISFQLNHKWQSTIGLQGKTKLFDWYGTTFISKALGNIGISTALFSKCRSFNVNCFESFKSPTKENGHLSLSHIVINSWRRSLLITNTYLSCASLQKKNP